MHNRPYIELIMPDNLTLPCAYIYIYNDGSVKSLLNNYYSSLTMAILGLLMVSIKNVVWSLNLFILQLLTETLTSDEEGK